MRKLLLTAAVSTSVIYLLGRLELREVPDSVLLQRIRTKLRRISSRPDTVNVAVREGHVRLRGQVLAQELLSVVMALESIRGVRSLISELDLADAEV